MVAALIAGSEWKGHFFLKNDDKKCSKEGENIIVHLIKCPSKLQQIF